MRLLILGGTEFAGRALAVAGLARGWDVTVFHRGSHEPPAGVRSLHGDRTVPGGLSELDGVATWDLVVDTWSAGPRAVRDSARLLAGRADRYVFVSTRSVYTWPPTAGYAEDHPVVEGSPDADATQYPQDKRGGELAAVEAFGEERSLLARAGLVLGPYENIGRLPWWLNRIARGGPVLAPGPYDLPLQYVDARDLAEWILDAAGAGLGGPFNLTSSSGHTTMGQLLDACVEVVGGTAELRWTDPRAILDAGIEPWTGLPIWIPPGTEDYDALHTADVSRAMATGLRCRPVRETVEDTWEWLRGIGGVAPQRPGRPSPGISPEAEAAALRPALGG